MRKNISDWIPEIKNLIEKNTQDVVQKIFPVNRNRHYIFETSRGLKYHMLFKRDFFYSFGKIFKKDGIGESINKEWVEFAIKNKIHNFIFIHKDKVYICPVREFYDYAKNNNTIRETSSGEITMSIPIRLLRRWI